MLFWILGIIGLIILLAGYYFASKVLYPQAQSRDYWLQKEIEAGRVDPVAWEKQPKEVVQIQSQYGYMLSGYFLPTAGSHKTVIILHGIKASISTAIKYMGAFQRNGFNIMLLDLRMHGESGGKSCTFGYYEKYDLKTVVDWVYTRMGMGGVVGVHGESLGAAVALQYAAIDDRAGFIVANCGFADLRELLAYRFRYDFHLPGWLFIPLADFFCTVISGMSFDSVSPIRDMSYIQAPVCIIHGADDAYVPVEMAQRLFNAKQHGIRHLHIVPGARHAESYQVNPEAYNQIIAEFLSRFGMLA